MTLNFYFGCESGSGALSASDYNRGADTAGGLQNSGSIGTTQVKVGTYSLRGPASANGGLNWTVGANDLLYPFTSSGVVLDTQGCLGYWSRQDTALYSTANTTQRGFRFRATASGTYALEGTYGGAGNTTNYSFRIAGSASTAKILTTTGGQITANNWFFEVYRWHFPLGKMRIEIYDSTTTLVDSAEDTAVSFTSTNTPADIANYVIGAKGSSNTNATDFDNFIVANRYDEPIQNCSTITTYTSYVPTRETRSYGFCV